MDVAQELQEALAGREPEELKEMGKRLQRSHTELSEVLREHEAEQEQLKEENAYLRRTIELMFQELQKLNIGSGNTVEPMLDEGPLDFLPRLWEKVKPRDSGVVVSEHVGEIRKPRQDAALEARQQLGDRAQQMGEQAVAKGKEVATRLSGALGPLWSRAEGFLNAAQGESAKASAPTRPRKHRDPASKEKHRGQGGLLNGPRAVVVATSGSAAASSGADAAAPATVPADDQGTQVAEDGAEAATSSSSAVVAAEADAGEPSAAADPQAEVSGEVSGEAGGEGRGSGAEDQISSTILIEAQLKIDDGSVQTLHVRAADRCKEVAHRFVQEHSLKALFKDPLTTWLKKVEADAVKFPVKIEADLMDIQKQHTKVK